MLYVQALSHNESLITSHTVALFLPPLLCVE